MPDQPALFEGMEVLANHSRLLNVLSKFPGSHESKREWLNVEIDLIVIEIRRDARKAMLNGEIWDDEVCRCELVSRVIRYYRQGIRRSQERGPETFDEASERRSKEWTESL